MARPNFSEIKSGKEFNQWYWLKKEMIAILKRYQLPYSGSKFELRDRIMYALDHNGELKPTKSKPKPSSRFNWAKETLTLDTIITDSVSFGPNFRRFMTSQIGPKFNCHGDFMTWVKSNSGRTLLDAVMTWEALELRKTNPDFKREIAKHNMYAQYTRDFLEDNKDASLDMVRACWMLKKQRPAKNGFVIYESSDLDLLHQS